MKIEDVTINDETIYDLSNRLCSDNIAYQIADYVNKHRQEYFDFFRQLDENKKCKLFVIYYINGCVDYKVWGYEK